MDDERAFSYGLQVGNMVWISGTTARDDNGTVVGVGDMEAQAQKCLENIETILREAGGTRDDVVKLTVYLADRGYRDRFQQVRKRFFRPPYPASAMVVGTMVLPEYLVEIEAVAVLHDGSR
jgi:enamine deaminase RidA (YjgF/YER057c/UK114 family)